MTGGSPPGSLTPMGPGVEFDRIRGFLTGMVAHPHVRVGPGDDGAVLDSGIVLSTDLSVEGIHFRLDWITLEEVGWRAAAAAMSDLGAMGARPLGALVSVAVPAPGNAADLLMGGVRQLLDAMDTPLLGGDLTRSPGPVLIDVTVVGETKAPLLRSGARPGDELWVTGRDHGAPHAALEAWLAGKTPSPLARHAFARPVPRILEARWLAAHRTPTAGLDLSDGIASDAGHLAAASGVCVHLDGAALLSVAYRGAADAFDAISHDAIDPDLNRALFGGEGYEILFTLPPQAERGWVEEFEERFHLPVTRIGRVTEGSGVVLHSEEGAPPRSLKGGGWDHFSLGATPGPDLGPDLGSGPDLAEDGSNPEHTTNQASHVRDNF
jgi:thiamine-monophosphate kinase